MMSDIQRTLNMLYEQRRNAQRGLEKARREGDQLGVKRNEKEVKRIDGEIRNLL